MNTILNHHQIFALILKVISVLKQTLFLIRALRKFHKVLSSSNHTHDIGLFGQLRVFLDVATSQEELDPGPRVVYEIVSLPIVGLLFVRGLSFCPLIQLPCLVKTHAHLGLVPVDLLILSFLTTLSLVTFDFFVDFIHLIKNFELGLLELLGHAHSEIDV